MAEYWVEVQLDGEGGESPLTLPLAWFAYADLADMFAKTLVKLPGVRGAARGKEGRAHTRTWGKYVPSE